ncbi:MAG: 6-carboxytetrahydropterin synthase [Bacteroidota bacterium]|nr:6-carboxytetrahydropterin synthase [Bacteroidota bacterium]|tara:strand:- start:3146 stop:3571 length:426 start_codon:yes stop_codon:yes gene_type:complete
MIYIIRKEHFNAAHKLYNPLWSEEKNMEEFGVCSNENWHGHNYEIEVTIKGKINPDSGMLINLKDLSRIMKEEIIDKVDHKNLNIDVPFLEGIITTTENVTMKFWDVLEDKINSLENTECSLYKIRVYETPRNFVEYYGEK